MPAEAPRGAILSAERIKALSLEWDTAVANIVAAASERYGAPVPDDLPLAAQLEAGTMAHLREKAGNTQFVVISSIAGGGKSTIGAMLREMGFERLPRVTTRAPRPGERDGHDYEFMTREEFDRAKENGEFAYVKDTYGEGRAIRIKTLDTALQAGKRVYAEGDALAYHDIRSRLPEYASLAYLSIFLVPDSFATAWKRLSGRIEGDIANGASPAAAWKDAEERVEKGISYLKESAAHLRNGIYDGFLVNDDLVRVRERLDELFA